MAGLANFAPFILIFVVFYFFMIRPQMKKQKEHAAMVKALKKGDKVVIGGGIFGTVASATEDEVIKIDVAKGTQIEVMRSAIVSVTSKS